MDFTIDRNAGAEPQVSWLKLNGGPPGKRFMSGLDATCGVKVTKLDETSAAGTGSCQWKADPTNPLASAFDFSVTP